MKFTPLRITLIYFVFAVIWITSTDYILEWMFDDLMLLSQFQTVKGLFYITLTAILLFLMMKSYERFLSENKKEKESQKKSLNIALESARMGVWEYNVLQDSYITSENHNDLFGFGKEHELKLNDVYEKLHPDDLQEFKMRASQTLSDGTDFNIQYRVLLETGEVRWLWTRAEAQLNDGRVDKVSGITLDITKNKELEQQLDIEKERFEKLFEKIPVLIEVFDPELNISTVNREFEKVLGWTNEDLKEKDLLELGYPNPEYRERVKKWMLNPESGWEEFEVMTKSGDIRNQLWTNIRLSDNTIVGIGYDFTERKILETQILSERQELQAIFDSMPVFINVHDTDNMIGEVNRYFVEKFGYTNETVKNEDLLKLITTDDILEQAKNEIRKSDGSWVDFELFTKDGSSLFTTWTNIRISDSKSIGIGLDITERKKMEDELREREYLLTEIQRVSQLGSYTFKIAEGIWESSDKLNEIFGLEKGCKKTSEVWLNLVHEDHREMMSDYLENEVLKKKNDFDKEYVIRRASDGEERWVHGRGELQFDKDGTPVLMIGTIQDITERKRMEGEIRENEERLQLTTVSANIGIWEWYPKTGKTVFDETWANLVGYSLDELEPVSIETWNKLVHPDDYPLFEKAVDDYFSGSKPFYECEIRMKHKEGHWVWILDRGQAVEWDENDEPIKLVGTHIDISTRVAYEKSLAYQASLLANVSDAIISVDKDFRIISWNNAAEKIYGWKKEEVKGKLFREVIETVYEDENTSELAFDKLKESGLWQGEILQKTKDGELKNIFSSVTLIRDADGEIADIISVNRNVTERKEYERENRLLANVFLNSNTALSVSNHQTNKLERVNRAYSSLLGYTEEELIGLDIHDLYPEDYKNQVLSQLDLLDMRGYTSFEAKLIRKDRTTLNAIINLSVVRDDKFGQDYRISTVQDISELKEIQEQLDRERYRFEMAANTVSDVVWEWNPEKGELWWGEGLESVMGYKRKDFEGKIDFWQNHIHKDDRDRIIKSMEHAENSSVSEWEAEYRFIAADGTLRNVKDSAFLIRDEDGKLIRIIGAMVDITQVLEFQNTLKRERNRFELIAKSSNDVLYDYDLKSGAVWWSEGWQTRFGFKSKDIRTNVDWWSENIHPEDQKKVLKGLYSAIEMNSDSWNDTYRFRAGEGDYRIVVDKGYFIKDEEEENVHLVGTITDVTIDIEARESLKASEEQYRLLFNQSPLPMYIYDPNTLSFITANDSAIEKYGYMLNELKQMKIYELHPKNEQKAVKEEIARSLKKKRTGFDTWHQESKNGDKIIAEISGSEIAYEGKVMRLVVANDITEQKQAEERAISAIIEGEERERQRIAKELHDGLGQYLSAANMNLESVFEDTENLPKLIAGTFKNGMELLNYAISETRNISQNLLPKAIQDYGLELGIEALINQLRSSNKIEFYLYRNLDNVEIPENIQINLYRIAQEALNNAIKHGKPDNVNVQLVYTEGEILMVVEDDGRGFVPDEVSGDGLGLRSMKTRVGAMAANIDIVSTVGRGTIISVVVPL
jgi:PAS domain S-box-containing protein